MSKYLQKAERIVYPSRWVLQPVWTKRSSTIFRRYLRRTMFLRAPWRSTYDNCYLIKLVLHVTVTLLLPLDTLSIAHVAWRYRSSSTLIALIKKISVGNVDRVDLTIERRTTPNIRTHQSAFDWPMEISPLRLQYPNSPRWPKSQPRDPV